MPPIRTRYRATLVRRDATRRAAIACRASQSPLSPGVLRDDAWRCRSRRPGAAAAADACLMPARSACTRRALIAHACTPLRLKAETIEAKRSSPQRRFAADVPACEVATCVHRQQLARMPPHAACKDVATRTAIASAQGRRLATLTPRAVKEHAAMARASAQHGDAPRCQPTFKEASGAMRQLRCAKMSQPRHERHAGNAIPCTADVDPHSDDSATTPPPILATPSAHILPPPDAPPRRLLTRRLFTGGRVRPPFSSFSGSRDAAKQSSPARTMTSRSPFAAMRARRGCNARQR